MIWLVGQLWPWMLLSALLGAGVTAVLGTRRIVVERQVEMLAPQPEVALPVVDPFLRSEPPPAPAPVASPSPFPEVDLGGDNPRPWEDEELWSRPVRRSAGQTTSRPPTDEWEEAAANWRSWADEAVARADDPFPYTVPVEAPPAR